MDVAAYNSATSPAKEVTLGAIADQIWTNGFKRTQERTIQVSKPLNAAAPNLFDRLMRMENFQFAAGQSFENVGDALICMGTLPDTVPALAHLSFTQGNSTVWLGNCGIQRVELLTKSAALVIFGYTIIGGTWSTAKPF